MAREGKLFSNTLLLGASAAAGKVLSLLLLPFFTDVLTPAEFGACEIVISTALLLIPLFSLYAPQATFRFLAEGEARSARAGAFLLGAGALLFLLSVPIWGRVPALYPYRLVLIFFVLFSIGRSFTAQMLRAEGRFLLFSVQQLLCALLTAAFQFFFLRVWHLGAHGYLWGIVLGDGITFFCLLLYLLPRFCQKGRTSRHLCKEMLRYSLPLVPTALLWWGMSNADRYILLCFDGERATGLYAAAGRLPALVTFAAGVFLEAWHYAAVQVGKEARGARFGRVYALFAPVLLVLGGVCVAFSPLLVSIFLSDAYADAARLLGFLLFGAVCAGLSSFLDSIYTLQLRTAFSFYTCALATAVHLVLSFLLIPRLGAVGAAAANALGFFTLFALRARHTARLLKFPRFTRHLACSLFLLFGGATFLAGGALFWGVMTALLALLPLWDELLDAAILLMGRLDAFLNGSEKSKNILKKTVKYDKIK